MGGGQRLISLSCSTLCLEQSLLLSLTLANKPLIEILCLHLSTLRSQACGTTPSFFIGVLNSGLRVCRVSPLPTEPLPGPTDLSYVLSPCGWNTGGNFHPLTAVGSSHPPHSSSCFDNYPESLIILFWLAMPTSFSTFLLSQMKTEHFVPLLQAGLICLLTNNSPLRH